MTEMIRQKTSTTRQTEPGGWRVLARQHDRGVLLPAHAHQTGQLVFALSGVMLVESRNSHWTVPPQRALWIPPGQQHAIRMLSLTEMRTVYFEAGLIREAEHATQQGIVHAIVASPLVKELVLGLFDDTRHSYVGRRLMARLLLQTVCEAEVLRTELPMPSDERLRRAVMLLLSANAWNMSTFDLADSAAMSERSFTRHFTNDVGLSFRAWKQRARIVASLDLLAQNRSIKHIAVAMCFASPAAYVASFRDLLGTTPSAFRQ